MEIKPNNYYLDRENCLIYVIGKSELGGTYIAQYLWDFVCLRYDRKDRMDMESLQQILVKDLGPTIAPAMRLLYAKSALGR